MSNVLEATVELLIASVSQGAVCYEDRFFFFQLFGKPIGKLSPGFDEQHYFLLFIMLSFETQTKLVAF